MVGRMNKVVVNKLVNIGMWVFLIGSVVLLISSDGPVDYGLVAVAFLMAASLFTDSQKKRSGDKKRGGLTHVPNAERINEGPNHRHASTNPPPCFSQ